MEATITPRDAEDLFDWLENNGRPATEEEIEQLWRDMGGES